MSKKIFVCCHGCGKNFEKELRYVKVAEKKGRKNFCSLKCHAINEGYKHLPGESWNKSDENHSHLRKICSNRKDEFSPFKSLLKSCRNRNKDCDLDLQYLKDLWEKQKGKCAVTGVDLILKESYNKNYQASIDRLDSSRGYVKGNIRFTSVSVNWLKSNLDDNHLMEFFQICRMVV